MQLKVGEIVEGTVKSLTKFGAFVALDATTTGLVHISEVAHAYVSDIHDYLTEGQTVKVMVIGLENGKINLSIKRTLPAPTRQQSQRPRGGAQQRQTKQTDQHDGDDQGALHLLGGNHPFLHPAQRPDAIRFITPLNRVAVVIGEVGKNLQQAGGDQRQQGNPGIKMALLPGKDGANNNRGKCQR